MTKNIFGKIDLVWLGLFGGLYIYFTFAGYVLYSIIAGLLLGTWFIWKPPEAAIVGVKGISKHLGLSEYTAGVISSLVSNIPEAVIVGLAIYYSYKTNNIKLMEIGLLLVLATIGMNLILLGIVILIGAKEGYINVPRETIEYDIELYRFVFVGIFALIGYYIAHAIFLVGGTGSVTVKIPKYFSAILFVSYPLYLLLSPKKASRVAESPLSLSKSILFFLFGNFGIFLGGELIISNTEELLLEMEQQFSTIGNPVVVIALILAVLAAIPEHFIAVKSAYRGDINIALGNLLGGISQIILIILFGVGMIIEIPLDKYTLFQLLIVALQFWYIKRGIMDDEKLDRFEGIMIILFQILAFALLVSG